MKEKIWDIILVGGGASSMMAALFAKNKNNSILILEKNRVLGKKILISGNGRCNFTNKNLELNRYLTDSKEFLKTIFSNFDNNSIIDFFKINGSLSTIDRFGRVLPYTNEASTIQEILVREIKYANISISKNNRVLDIKKKNGIFKIKTEKEIFNSKYLILATGGIATPIHGTTGDGYTMAKKLGHTITPLVPTIVPLVIKKNPFFKIQGVKVPAIINLKYKNKKSFSEMGELLFTKYGISGPVTLDLTVPLSKYGIKNSKLTISFLPDSSGFDEEFLIDRFSNLGKKYTYKDFFTGIFPTKFIEKFISQLCKELSIKIDSTPFHNGIKNYKKLIKLLKNFSIIVESFKPAEFARTNYGGIPISEINKNCESKLIKNLFLTGELLDVTGYSGGYNLQFAFSTGAMVGNFLKNRS